MISESSHWQMLILAFEGGQDSVRVRAWRALKALGAATLRDGVYLLPDQPALCTALGEIAATVRDSGNQAYALPFVASQDEQSRLPGLFDRASEYRALQIEADALEQGLATLAETELRKRLRQLLRNADQLRRSDYFPGPGRAALERRLERVAARTQARLSPDEPSPAPTARSATGISRLLPGAYRGRVWATRAGLWVDRVASAWLIREFIDSEARFVWLDTPASCPKDALGFDFDGATFSHVGDCVTFEVLLHAFGLNDDSGLSGVAELVHGLDVGGPCVAEAAGFEAILIGAKTLCGDDDTLLARITPVLHDLRQAYNDPPGRTR